VRHEAGGGHAAEGYAKASGKVGVCFATSGPGATNIVTPLTDAMMDSVPLVFFTGQVRTDLLGTDGFQEADTVRHHDADRQALVHDPAPDGDPAGRARGVPHRAHGPSRARC
jgi:glyoxylate carboligase